MRVLTIFSAAMILMIALTGFFAGEDKQNQKSPMSAVLQDAIVAAAKQDSLPVWVFFKDKEHSSELVQPFINDAALKRRQIRKARMTDDYDIPVPEKFIGQLRLYGFRVKHISRWLNAVSGKVTADGLERIAQLPFVSSIDAVRSVKRKIENPEQEFTLSEKIFRAADSVRYDSLFYGQSYRQNAIVKTPAVHEAGYAGQDVIVAVFDAGFNNLAHESFDSLRIMAKWDFVNGDSSVADDPGQAGYGGHGTNVLSVIAGYKPGKLIGPAFRSNYILAKTENTESERPVEEDNWIAALEWAEQLGADIVSSSVGYLEFDSSGNNQYDSSAYNWTWMTGNSTRITKAANIAAEKGMIIVNSAGNEYAHPSRNTLIAPADGFRVIAVGAVDNTGVRSGFSSVGPTTAGRIKPDAMAMGSGVLMASSLSATHYTTGGGTSFSCPMVAGICAQMLSAMPDITADQMMNALHKTSGRSKNPDNKYGYGLVDAVKLLSYLSDEVVIEKNKLLQNYPNPFRYTTNIRFKLSTEQVVTISVYNILGQKIKRLALRIFPAGPHESVQWDGTDNRGKRVASGIYICRIETPSWKKSGKMVFLRN